MTATPSQRHKADALRALHQAPPILVLPNAWDVASSKIFELAGFHAIGTTSAGIAASLGYADGEQMTLGENAQVVRRIAASTFLPVNADIEAGYSTTVDGVVDAARAMLAAGAVGVNLEDSTGDPSAPLLECARHAELLRALRTLDAETGVPLVINARTDVYLVGGDPAHHLRHAIERGNAYREAGADCIFIPDAGNLDRRSIALLVREIAAPVNIFARATTPSIPELQDIGVARVSFGSGPMNALLGFLRQISEELATTGTYTLMTKSALTYAEVNRWYSDGESSHHPT